MAAATPAAGALWRPLRCHAVWAKRTPHARACGGQRSSRLSRRRHPMPKVVYCPQPRRAAMAILRSRGRSGGRNTTMFLPPVATDYERSGMHIRVPLPFPPLACNLGPSRLSLVAGIAAGRQAAALAGVWARALGHALCDLLEHPGKGFVVAGVPVRPCCCSPQRLWAGGCGYDGRLALPPKRLRGQGGELLPASWARDERRRHCPGHTSLVVRSLAARRSCCHAVLPARARRGAADDDGDIVHGRVA